MESWESKIGELGVEAWRFRSRSFGSLEYKHGYLGVKVWGISSRIIES